MAKTAKSLSDSYPQPVASWILKAELQRQNSLLRHELVAELVDLATEISAPDERKKLLAALDRNLRLGVECAREAEKLWPEAGLVQQRIGEATEKKSLQQKHLNLFKQLESAHRKSLRVLLDSFDHVQAVVDKIRPVPLAAPAPAPAKARVAAVAASR
jgi:hypothetical protein